MKVVSVFCAFYCSVQIPVSVSHSFNHSFWSNESLLCDTSSWTNVLDRTLPTRNKLILLFQEHNTQKKMEFWLFISQERGVIWCFFYVLVLFYKEITLGWTLFCLMLILNSVRVEFDGMVYLQDNSNFLLKEF